MKPERRGPNVAAESFCTKFDLMESDESAGSFRGMASVFGAPIDCYPPSVIERGAFTKTLQDQGKRVKILWQHDTWNPIGRPTSMVETDQGLEIVAVLDPVEDGIRAMKQIRSGTLTDLSIGFDPIKWEMVQTPGNPDPVRVIKEARLWEVSVVTFGAQRSARMAAFAMSYRDLPVERREWDAAGAFKRLEAWADGDQERLYRGFLAAGVEGLQFQIADVVDGRLVVVPGALHAAARGVIESKDLPPRVVEYAREHLSSYFLKAGEVAPWDAPVVAVPEALAGKVLSKKNKSLVDAALQALQALAEAAKEAEAEDEGEEEQPELSALAKPEDPKPAAEPEVTTEPVERNAVPSPEPAAAEDVPVVDPLASVEFRLKEMRLALAVRA